MKHLKCRVFVPSSKFIGNTSIITCVDKWIWTKNKGLQVVYTNGQKYRSDYKNIKELLSGERVTEIS